MGLYIGQLPASEAFQETINLLLNRKYQLTNTREHVELL